VGKPDARLLRSTNSSYDAQVATSLVTRWEMVGKKTGYSRSSVYGGPSKGLPISVGGGEKSQTDHVNVSITTSARAGGRSGVGVGKGGTHLEVKKKKKKKK